MFSGGIEVNSSAKIRLILETKFGDDYLSNNGINKSTASFESL